jgi:hypothetical protein
MNLSVLADADSDADSDADPDADGFGRLLNQGKEASIGTRDIIERILISWRIHELICLTS